MNLRKVGFFKGCCLLVGVLFTFGCRDPNKRTGLEYREETRDQTVSMTESVFGDGISDPHEKDAALERFFTSLSVATRSEGEIDVNEFLSLDGMLEMMDSLGLFDGLGKRQRAEFARGFRNSAGNLGISLRQMAFDHFRILRVERISEAQRIAYVRHYDNEIGVTHQIRWWLTRTENGWRVYDFEDLSVGLRSIGLIGVLGKSGLMSKPEPWIADFMPLAAGIHKMDVSDPESLITLEEPLKKLRTYDLPEDIRKFASVLMVGIHQVKGDPDSALAELEAADAGGYQSPLKDYMYGSVMLALERPEEALQHFESHAKILGWDSDVLESVSDAHFQLGEIDKAREAALKGMADNPQASNCLASLAIACSVDQLRDPEFRVHFQRMETGEAAYEVALDYVIEAGTMPQAEALFELFKGDFPESELIGYYENALMEAADEQSVIR